MRYLPLLLLILAPLSALLAQASKKEIKQAVEEISIQFESQDYDSTILLINDLTNRTKNISPNTYKYWINTAIEKHDLFPAIQCVNHFLKYKEEFKLEKKVDAVTLNKIYKVKNEYLNISDYINNFTSNNIERINYLSRLNVGEIAFWQIPYYKGVYEFNEGLFNESLNSFHQVIKLGFVDDEINEMIAKSYYLLKDYNQTIDYCKRVNTKNDDLLYIQSHSLYLLGEYDKSEIIACELFNNENLKSEALNIALQCSKKKGNKIKSVNYLLMMDLESRYDLRLNFISLVKELKIENEIIKSLDSLILITPSKSTYYLIKSDLYSNDINYLDESIENWNKLIQTDTSNYLFYKYKGDYLFNLTKGSNNNQLRYKLKNEASLAYEKALKLNPDNFETYEMLCRTFMWLDSKQTRHFKKLALEYYRNKLDSNKYNPESNYNLAMAYDLPNNGYGNSNRDKDSTIKYLNNALKYGYDSISIFYQLNSVYFLTKDYLKCIEINLKLYKSENVYNKGEILSKIAFCYLRLEDYENSKRYFEKVKTEFPETRNIDINLRIVNKLKN